MLKWLIVGVIAAVALLLMPLAAPAQAHPHTIRVSGQVIAHGHNHPGFDSTGLACGWYDPAGGVGAAPIGHAWYGLESAHHGPDEGAPGKGDGCYQLTGTLPGDDVANPVIR